MAGAIRSLVGERTPKTNNFETPQKTLLLLDISVRSRRRTPVQKSTPTRWRDSGKLRDLSPRSENPEETEESRGQKRQEALNSKLSCTVQQRRQSTDPSRMYVRKQGIGGKIETVETLLEAELSLQRPGNHDLLVWNTPTHLKGELRR